jgi:UDP-N-acetylmuramate: L-alanyl-gamma-D-glutamyl-meso-diaminopimelate ligase
LELKRLPLLNPGLVKGGFAEEKLQVFNKREDLETFLNNHSYENSTVLLMSSGNYDGLDLDAFSRKATSAVP